MKNMFFSIAFFACSISVATAQKDHLRLSAYFDIYPVEGFPIELGVTGAYKPIKWFRVGTDVGMLTASGQHNVYLKSSENTHVFYLRKRQPVALTWTVRPSLLLGKMFSLDLNIANYFGVKEFENKFLSFQPGCTLRYDRMEIRGRYIPQSGAVGLGLNVLIARKSK
jgi:hypothetical protein